MPIALDLVESARREVRVGAYLWTIEKPTNDIMIAHGVAWIDLLPAQAKRDAIEAGKVTPEAVRALASQLTAANLAKSQELSAKTNAALVCAGVVAARGTEDDAPEAVRFVLDRRAELPNEGAVWVERLDASTLGELAGHVHALLTEGVSARVATFRGPG